MLYEWDNAKNRKNVETHGIGFENAERFEWDTALLIIDSREDYGEVREIALGFIGIGLHVMVFTERGDKIRIISLRKATKQEHYRYADEA